jgi:hypothetical protein
MRSARDLLSISDRIIGFAVHAGNVDGPTLCRMFNQATTKQGWPKRISLNIS